jgi:hypothetical protein
VHLFENSLDIILAVVEHWHLILPCVSKPQAIGQSDNIGLTEDVEQVSKQGFAMEDGILLS